MESSQSLPFSLFDSFFQSLLLFPDVVEFLNSTSLSIFFTTLSTHMIKSKLINQLTQHQRFGYERGIKCYQVWGLWVVLIAAVDQWWLEVSGMVHYSAFASAKFCSATVPLPKSLVLRSSLFCCKLGVFFFFWQWLRNPLFFPFYYMCVLP